MVSLVAAYLIGGACVGILAGLLGLGGGVIIVPLLNMIFAWQGFPEGIIQHMALGTSMASIVFTSISSFMAHHRRGSVDWSIWKAISPGIVVGTFGGALLAGYLPSASLKIFFVVFLFVVGTQMLCNFKPKPSRHLPSRPRILAVGGGIGLLSSFAGIGGGTMSVPFMTFCNVPVRVAMGTSAAIGFSIALAGSFGYMFSEVSGQTLPEWSIGFIYLPALAALVIPSVLTAPLGTRIAHALPVDTLKRFFGLFVYAMALRMLWGLF